MPLYEYEILDSSEQVVATVNIPLPVAERDGVTLRRVPIPRHLNVSLPQSEETHQANDVMRCLKRGEARQGSEYLTKLGYSPETLKQVWAKPTSQNTA